MTGAICGPSGYVERRRDPEPERWCFGERKRRSGVHVLLVPLPDPDGMPSWWGPIWQYRCDGCGGDHRLGFGAVWEYAE